MVFEMVKVSLVFVIATFVDDHEYFLCRMNNFKVEEEAKLHGDILQVVD